MQGMGPAKATVFTELKLLRSILLVFGCRVVALLALTARQGNDVSHWVFLLYADAGTDVVTGTRGLNQQLGITR